MKNIFWRRAILHVDMDAFYAAIEQRDQPALRGKPVIIAGGERSVVSTCSYEARKFGVHSAMSTPQAKRLCPEGIFLPPDMPRYVEASLQIREVFAQFSPLVQPLSLDEAFLDCTNSQELFGAAPEIAQQIKTAVRAAVNLTCSVGVATTLFAAKIASDLHKPDGLTIIPAADALAILDPLPVRKIWGVGKVTGAKLKKLGIATIAELRTWRKENLAANFGDHLGGQLFNLARNLDDREIANEIPAEKSLSREITFPVDLWEIEKIENHLRDLADTVARRARRQRKIGKTVFLKVRYADFSTLTRQISLPAPTSAANIIFRAAQKLLREKTACGKRAARLIGVGIGDLTAPEIPISEINLFAGVDLTARKDKKMEKVEIMSDKIIGKFGESALRRGSKLLSTTNTSSKNQLQKK